MKTKPVILLAAISTLLAIGASAQDAPPPGAPPPPGARGDAPRPPREGDAPRPPRDGDAPRPPGGPGEGFRRGPRDGDAPRVPGGPRDGADKGPGPRDGAGRGPGAPDGPRDGAGRGPGGPDGPRDGARLGGPRDGAGKGPDGPRDGGPRSAFPDAPREVKKETRAFLGVLATPVPPPLAAQLSLSEGFGLVVMEVAPDSPAAKAGVQKFDVLKLLNDQQIVDQNQLATLVSGQGKGKEVSLTVIRKAQEQKISATLGEHTVTIRENHGMPGMPGNPGHSGFGMTPEMRERIELHSSPERAREMQEKMHEFQEHMKSRREGKPGDGKPGEGRPGDGKPGDRKPGEGRPGAAIDPERLLQEAQIATGVQIHVDSDAGTTTINSAQAHLHLKDNTGEIDIASKDGQRVLTATDPEGNVIYTGPVNSDEERAALPEPIRKKLAEIRIREDIRGSAPFAEVSVGIVPGAAGANREIDEADFQ